MCMHVCIGGVGRGKSQEGNLLMHESLWSDIWEFEIDMVKLMASKATKILNVKVLRKQCLGALLLQRMYGTCMCILDAAWCMQDGPLI